MATSRRTGPQGGRPSVSRRTTLTGRAAVLALVVGVLVVLLAYPLRQYVEHRARVAALQQENEQRRDTVGRLKQHVDRLKDPAYVKAEARRRLHFVMPGEVDYITVRQGGGSPSGDGLGGVGASLPDDVSWYARLWSSVQAASGEASEGAGATSGAEPPSQESP